MGYINKIHLEYPLKLQYSTRGGGSLTTKKLELQVEDIPIDLDLNKDGKQMVLKIGKHMPKVALILTMQVISSKIKEKIQYMLDHVMIGKFVGMQIQKNP